MSDLHQHYLSMDVNEPLNLLVVDDEENNLKAIYRSFRGTNYQVYTAMSAKDGYKLLEQHKFQVVLSDFRMPEIDGGTFVKSIQQKYPEIVSMILTGYADFEAAVDVMNSGAAYKFLTKPWQNKQLISDVGLAFQEYNNRLIASAKDKLNEEYIKPQKVQFDKTLDTLQQQQSQFALLSVIVSDISLYDHYWEHRGGHDLALDFVAKVLRDNLDEQSQVFEVDMDQLLVIIPGQQNVLELHQKLTVLDKALSVSGENDPNVPKLKCHLAYALAPFEGMTARQLLHSIRSLSEQDYRENLRGTEKSQVVRYDASFVAQKKRKKTIQNSIQQAIDANQFSLYYQPKVRVDNGLVETAEVLMRWQHNSLGWVSPLEFISLSELDGQIEQIGSWLIEKSVAELIDLRQRFGETLKLAINVSPRQLQNNNIVEQLSELLERTGLNPACLELEVTEGCIIEDLQQTSDILWTLKGLGVSISIDDFGSGYSSFAYLSKLPVDVLKLDKILIDDLGINDDVSDMLHSIIQLCRRMNIEVVAEGVEDEGQVQLLREFGCHYIQGFVFSRPVEKVQFEDIIKNQPFTLTDTP